MNDDQNLLEHVKILATSDGRAVGTPGHERARKYICANLKHLGLIPYAESFELPDQTDDLQLTNIVAVAPGMDRQAPPVLLGAHYDTVESSPGADDNAAAVAILLEIGKYLKQTPVACDVILAFFDGEEFGGLDKSMMGSTKFYYKQSTRPVRCGLILDLVGHDVPILNLENTMFVTGMESSSSWMQKLLSAELKSSIVWAPVLDDYIDSPSDHYVYVKNEVPYLFFSCGIWEHYHATSDTYDKLNYTKMTEFLSSLLFIVHSCASEILSTEPYISTSDELAFLRKNITPKLEHFHASMKSRRHIDKLAYYLRSNFDV